MEWRRLLDAPDINHDRAILLNNTHFVLYAVNSDSPPESNTTFAR